MSRVLKIPGELFSSLERSAHQLGLSSIEELLEKWNDEEGHRETRRAAVQRIDALRASLLQKYGEMSDSVPQIREDRDR